MAETSFDDIAGLSFEKALQELEEIVEKLEAGEAPLDQSIALYERGAALKAHCDAALRDAREKVEKIVLDASGAPRTEPADIA